MMHGWYGAWGAGNWLLMGLGMLLFWALMAALIVWLVASATGRAARTPRRDGPGSDTVSRSDARAILAERYARGEIDHEEYRMRRDVLGAE